MRSAILKATIGIVSLYAGCYFGSLETTWWSFATVALCYFTIVISSVLAIYDFMEAK